MQTLFPVEPNYPEGFSYIPNFISGAEERSLVDHIGRMELHSFIFQGFEAKRRMASFGYDYSFERRELIKGKDIPLPFQPLITQVAMHLGIEAGNFAELLILEYPAGAVINWHRDAPPFDLIAGISLLSDCTFRLRPQEKSKQNRKAIISVPVERRSLYIMDGPARSEWQHSTSPVKALRYSITLRTLRNPEGL
jgi:alkylated DNA repair dioxygenase AlkB